MTFLGFCGAPWTVATYMIAGHGTPDQAPARLFAYRHPDAFDDLINLLVKASAEYLIQQLKAGVDAVQIFDTWAGVLPPEEFARWCDRADPADRSRSARGDPGCQDHRFSARCRHGAGALCHRGATECGWPRLDDRQDLCARAHPDDQAGAGQSRSAGADRRRRGARSLGRRRDARVLGWAVHLQSRPRHHAGDADRPCRADAASRRAFARRA